MAEVRPVTKVNWRELSKLKVHSEQEHFVASNLYSIAEAQFGYDEPDGNHWDIYPFGIYNDNGEPVGFLMYGCNFSSADMQAFITRLMVDERYQGYGRFGMNWMLDLFRKEERISTVGISYEPENDVARKLYASLGFVEPGRMLEGETLAILKLR